MDFLTIRREYEADPADQAKQQAYYHACMRLNLFDKPIQDFFQEADIPVFAIWSDIHRYILVWTLGPGIYEPTSSHHHAQGIKRENEKFKLFSIDDSLAPGAWRRYKIKSLDGKKELLPACIAFDDYLKDTKYTILLDILNVKELLRDKPTSYDGFVEACKPAQKTVFSILEKNFLQSAYEHSMPNR